MRIVVPQRAVPDIVEELELTPDETDIDREYLKFVLSEWDDQALEEALLVKEASGAEIVAVGFAADPDIQQALYTAVAKGADTAVMLTGIEDVRSTATRASALADYVRGAGADLVMTGVQALDDLDGLVPPMLGALLGWPHISVVVGVEAKEGSARVRQEFSGGWYTELDVAFPAVLGIQAARQSPRYAPITKIRQAMKAGGLEEIAVSGTPATAGLTVRRMYVPEKTGHAEMIDGKVEDVAGKIVELLRGRGLVKG